MSRIATKKRETKETSILVDLDVDGSGTSEVSTGLPFFDHMLDQLARHGSFDLKVLANGDLHVDGHHTIEDVGITLGTVFGEALGDKAGVARFASGLFPLDEALVEVALDLSGRPFVVWDVPFGEVLPLGDPPFNRRWPDTSGSRSPPQPASRCTCASAPATNTHHVIEASFKGIARCLRAAVRVEGTGVPSTKGAL